MRSVARSSRRLLQAASRLNAATSMVPSLPLQAMSVSLHPSAASIMPSSASPLSRRFSTSTSTSTTASPSSLPSDSPSSSTSSNSSSSSTTSSTSSTSTSASTPTPTQASSTADVDAEPINPEEYARRQAAARGGRVDEDEDDWGEDEAAREEEAQSESDRAWARQILDASLRFIPDHGWSVRSLQLGAESLGLSSASHALVKDGEVGLVYHVMDLAEERMKEEMSKRPLHTMTTSSRLELALRLRLEGIQPYLSQWPQAMALASQPQHVATSLKRLAKMIDDIWYICGDKSTDINYYTKRSLLAGVYVSTELYMLTDRSVGLTSTWSFLHRQLDAARGLAHLPAHAETCANVAVNVGATIWQRLMPHRS